MDLDFNKLTLIDLISEKHAQLRKIVAQEWEKQSEIQLSHTEWYLLSKIDQKSLTISQAATIIGMSRQAMQKSVIKLEKQGYITSAYKEGNKRDKFLNLTKTGNDCCTKNNQLKIKLESELEKLLGKQEFERIKDLFKKEWTF